MKPTKDVPLWQWFLILFFSFFAFTILNGLSQLPAMTLTNKGLISFCSLLLPLLLLLAYYGWIRWNEGRKAEDVALSSLLPETGKGLLMGIVYFVIVVGLMMLFGLYRIKSTTFDLGQQLMQFCFFFVIAVGEEITFRGVLFRMIDERWNTWIALIVSTIFFGLLHIFNPNATWWSTLAIALESGLLLGAAYKYSGTLWLPIGIHWAWNYMQGCVFGFAVSGNEFGESIITPCVEGPELLTGGSFGAEASLIAVIVGMLFAWYYIRKLIPHNPS